MTLTVQRNVSLQSLNTMAVPALADYLIEVDSIQMIKQAVTLAAQKNLPIFVLGGGSNTLFTQDYQGMILLNRLIGTEVLEEDSRSVLLKVAAGENWHRLVTYTLEQGWYGLENLALIPGLVGAAPIQNIGAYGVEAKDSIVSVEFLDFKTLQLNNMDNAECQFAYRDSIFKKAKKGKGLISAVTFRLHKQPSVNLSFPALAERLADDEKTCPNKVFAAVCAIRSEKLPLPADIPNLGSFFKNPILTSQQHGKLKKKYPSLISFPCQSGFKLAAAWLIDTAGWKLKRINLVGVHKRQALVIINPHRVSGAE
ncbi:UDP-N-acetylmuramate dehydrogenase, partial [Arenicella sp.]|nr:UDP-N-acetylmuramate dehydrogenase [Arenicella sp.]